MISNSSVDLPELQGLSEQEREIALKILGDMSDNGKSKDYDDILYADYEEIPVDIETFLHDKRYLGNALITAEGKFTVFPYWVETLKKIFPNNIDTAYNTLILTGGIGLGKSFVADICIAYLLHRMLCLRDPYMHYGLQPIDKITFSFINVTIDAAKGVAWDKIQQLLQSSSWFMTHGTISGRSEVVWTPSKRIELVLGSSNNAVIGRAVYANFTDEVNYAAMTSNVEKIKTKQMHLISQVDARMQSRFMKGNKLPTLNIIASSKNSEQSFLESYIELKKKNESQTTLVIDEPQWVIRNDKDSPEKFYVAVGNKMLASEVLPKGSPKELADEYRDKGYEILEVPSGYWEAFNDNVELALTDIAGKSTVNALKYISGSRFKQIKVTTYENPFSREVIKVGTNDDIQYSDFFDMSKVSDIDRYKPLFVHLDMSKTGDRTGIAGIWIIGRRGNEIYYKVAFSVAIEAPKGYEISFEKNRNFIRWLKQAGFRVRSVSSDTFQSAQIQQQLTADGFEVKTISVDRLDNIEGTSQKVCLPYAYFKSTIYEKRLSVYYRCDLLTEEIIGLERESDGHINHPQAGTQGCFTGDTKVSLVDGRELTFLQLVDEYNSGKVNYVYSFNHLTKRVEAKRIRKAWCTKKNAELMKVTLDDGSEIRCTPNHKFMLRDGQYVEACDLISGDSLMPLYRKHLTPEESPMYPYRLYYEPIEDKWHFEHRQFVEAESDGSHDIVHHINFNKDDNTPENLIYCSRQYHAYLHSKLSSGAWSEKACIKRSESLKKYHAQAKGTPEYEERNRKLSEAMINKQPEGRHEEIVAERERSRLNGIRLRELSASRKEQKLQRILNIEKMFNVVWDQLSSNDRDKYSLLYTRAIDPDIQRRITEKVKENHKLGKYLNANAALSKSNEESKKLKELIPDIDEDRFFSIFGIRYSEIPNRKKGPYAVKYRRIVAKKILNHKVKSVEFIDECEDVFDIEVEDNHNFALSCGVFVHNSKDLCDAVCGAIWNASKHIEEYSYDYGEDINTLVAANESDSLDSMQQKMNEAFEEEIKRTFLPPPTPEERKVVDTRLDFGMGKAQPVTNQYLSQGILLW